MKNSILLVLCVVVMAACGATNKPATEEKIFVVNITPDKKKLAEYLQYHEKVWPEVEAGFQKAGYQKITLYRYQHLLVMKIQVPLGADMQKMGKIAEGYSPRCAEWNKMMAAHQEGVPGTQPGETWVEALPFYEFNKK